MVCSSKMEIFRLTPDVADGWAVRPLLASVKVLRDGQVGATGWLLHGESISWHAAIGTQHSFEGRLLNICHTFCHDEDYEVH